jgi:hypothetical protein
LRQQGHQKSRQNNPDPHSNDWGTDQWHAKRDAAACSISPSLLLQAFQAGENMACVSSARLTQ